MRRKIDLIIPALVLIAIVLVSIFIYKVLPLKIIQIYSDTISIPKDLTTGTSGTIGDTFGGLLGPIVAIGASYITFLAFWIQYISNKQQREDITIERFENKFYEMIQIHRNNVSEIKIGKTLEGRKSFIAMYKELKFIYLFTCKLYSITFKKQKLNQEDKTIAYNISYLIFFFGLGKISTPIVKDLIPEIYHPFIIEVEKELNEIKKNKEDDGLFVAYNDVIFHLKLSYNPFNGHMSRLSHYIRHLFQLVKFVDEADSKLFNYESKYNYVSTLRSQLTTHEQILIYYNAISILGQPWLEKKGESQEDYLIKYCVLKSLPLPLADFYKTPIDIFGIKTQNKNKKTLFEWYEIKERFSNIESSKLNNKEAL